MVSKSRNFRELRVEAGFPQDEWALLLAEVKADLRDPENSIGLGGPSRYGQAWEEWVDDYIDSGVGEKYWGEGKGRMWDFGVNSNTIRKFMKVLIGIAAGIERGKQVARLKRQSRQITSGKAECEEDEESVGGGGEGLGSGDTQVNESENVDGGREEKQEREVDGEEGEEEEEEEEETKKEKEHVLFGGPSLLPSTPDDSSIKLGLVFQTRLAGSNKIKFIYSSDTSSLPKFIRKVREKFGLGRYKTIVNIEAEIGGKVYVVDLRDERDWQQIVTIAGKSNGVEIVVAI